MKTPLDLAGYKTEAECQEHKWCSKFLAKVSSTCLRTPENFESCKTYLLSLKEGATFRAAGTLIPYFYKILEQFDYASATPKERRELHETWNEVVEALTIRMEFMEENNPSINNPLEIYMPTKPKR